MRLDYSALCHWIGKKKMHQSSLQKAHVQLLLWSLQSVHLQFSGIQDLIRSLKIFKLALSLMIFGIIVFQTMGPKLRIEPLPIFSVRTFVE